jgi:hypothetical protein
MSRKTVKSSRKWIAKGNWLLQLLGRQLPSENRGQIKGELLPVLPLVDKARTSE